MRLEHVAVWSRDIERLKDFYVKYFKALPNEMYSSVHDFDRRFSSYFLSFDNDCRLELMQMAGIPEGAGDRETLGLTHFSFAVDSQEEVDALAARLEADGYALAGRPRLTGDGFYEACVFDPDGNRVEFAVLPA